MRTLYAATLLALTATGPVLAQNDQDWFDRAEGRWQAEGMSFGLPSASRMNWSETLDGRFQRLDYRIEMTAPDGSTRVFEGVAHYRTTETGIEGYWADTTGDLHPISAEADDAALTSQWGRAGGEQGRSEYRFTETGMTVTDWLLTAEGWREFNRTDFERTNG